jgi:hypothetical protein
MPAYLISDAELESLCSSLVEIVARQPG